MNAPSPVRSYLSRLAIAPTSAAELEDLRRRCWIETGIAVVHPLEINDDWLKVAVVQWATKKFGKRFKR